MKPVNLPYEFNIALLRLNRIPTTGEEKAYLLSAVARSTQSAELYLFFLGYGTNPVDPHSVHLAEATLFRLLNRFESLGIIEKAGRSRNKKGYMVNLWRLVC